MENKQSGAELIAVERRRQVAVDGEDYTAEHDDEHDKGELIDAGLSYIYAAINVGHPANAHAAERVAVGDL